VARADTAPVNLVQRANAVRELASRQKAAELAARRERLLRKKRRQQQQDCDSNSSPPEDEDDSDDDLPIGEMLEAELARL
jgi:hypothetical protein